MSHRYRKVISSKKKFRRGLYCKGQLGRIFRLIIMLFKILILIICLLRLVLILFSNSQRKFKLVMILNGFKKWYLLSRYLDIATRWDYFPRLAYFGRWVGLKYLTSGVIQDQPSGSVRLMIKFILNFIYNWCLIKWYIVPFFMILVNEFNVSHNVSLKKENNMV